MSRKLSPSFGIASGAVLLGLAVALWMAPAFACTRQGHIETHPAQAAPGATLRIEGSQFSASTTEPVNVYWGGTSPETSTLLASVHPAADGTFSVNVAIPANALVGQNYQLAATQADNPPFSANTALRVAQPTAAPVAPALVDQPLAQATSPAPAVVPAVGQSPAPADAAPPSADAPVPAVANASPYGVATLRAGAADSPARPLTEGAASKAFGGAHALSGGLSPWLLLPVGVVGITLLTGSAAYVARQARRERTLVHA